jgi:DNA transposition AAA+ family ATPase
MACREYQRRASNVWLATMSPATAGLQPMQARVLAAMGCDEQRTSPEALSARIKARMRGSRGLLIIDEAQELTERSLDEVRSWHDDTGVGIALVGDERVIARLGGQRARELARLHSRVSMRYPQARATAEDGATVARGWGLKDRAIVERLSQLAQRPGGLRGVVKTIKLASLVAGAGGVTLDEIDSAWRKLGYEAISGVAR